MDESAHTSDRWGGGNERDQQTEIASCFVWTELTVPVITAALSLKPALSDKVLAALVRGVEVAAEQPKLQVRTHERTHGRGRGSRTKIVHRRMGRSQRPLCIFLPFFRNPDLLLSFGRHGFCLCWLDSRFSPGRYSRFWQKGGKNKSAAESTAVAIKSSKFSMFQFAHQV